jgi:hypothetical protein
VRRRVKTQVFTQSMGLLQKAMPLAIRVLIKVASDVSAPLSAKVSAASALLKHGRDSLNTTPSMCTESTCRGYALSSSPWSPAFTLWWRVSYLLKPPTRWYRM